LIFWTSLESWEPRWHTAAAPGCLEKVLTILRNHDDGRLPELGMKEIVFGIPLPPRARGNMCFIGRVVAVHLTAAIAVVVVAGKHHMWVGQHLGVGNLIEEERGMVVLGLRTWVNTA
jgi:hypothetical protein